ncbi:MAG TPA: hypothetical protein VK932_19140, partial [Kofleriaceae bacterium]|nr:hypothetical protein [Kofleriaceae bacterium]
NKDAAIAAATAPVAQPAAAATPAQADGTKGRGAKAEPAAAAAAEGGEEGGGRRRAGTPPPPV